MFKKIQALDHLNYGLQWLKWLENEKLVKYSVIKIQNNENWEIIHWEFLSTRMLYCNGGGQELLSALGVFIVCIALFLLVTVYNKLHNMNDSKSTV